MKVTELWRYPVKSLAGERLERAVLGENGIEGDRRVYVARKLGGRPVTARTHPALLGHKAVLGPDGEPLVDGAPWTSEKVAAIVHAIAGFEARLARAPGGAFDVLPLLVATDGAIRAFGHDGRRLRPNIVIGGVVGLAERGWEGRALRVGEVVIEIQDLRGRCVMTTFDPDTQVQDVAVLEKIAREFDGTLALNCAVARGGTISVGDPVELLESV
jgi:uncharacterized protein YcbX